MFIRDCTDVKFAVSCQQFRFVKISKIIDVHTCFILQPVHNRIAIFEPVTTLIKIFVTRCDNLMYQNLPVTRCV